MFLYARYPIIFYSLLLINSILISKLTIIQILTSNNRIIIRGEAKTVYNLFQDTLSNPFKYIREIEYY